MMKSYPLLWKIYDHIVDDEDHWFQRRWATLVNPVPYLALDYDEVPKTYISGFDARDDDFIIEGALVNPNLCDTAFCVAGHAVNMTHNAWFILDTEGISFGFLDIDTGEILSISEAAREVLGLDYDEANRLFDADNDLEKIHAIITEWETAELAV
jgi:hypothetical protein